MPGRLAALTLLLALSITANAQVYKWTDKNGVVHYGDEQPERDHQQFRFEGYSEIEMGDNIQAERAIARERHAREKSGASGGGQGRKAAEERRARKHAATCQAYVDRIDWINSRLRSGGYSVTLGNRLRAERRELSSRRAWECLRH